MSRALLKQSLSPKRLHQSYSSREKKVTSATITSDNTTKCRERILQVWNATCIVTNFGKSHFCPTIPSSSLSSTPTTADDASSSSIPLSQNTMSLLSPSLTSTSNQSIKLINPANPNLSGVRDFPYFPRGGPVPKKQPNLQAHHIMGYVSQWGGMDVGSGALYTMLLL